MLVVPREHASFTEGQSPTAQSDVPPMGIAKAVPCVDPSSVSIQEKVPARVNVIVFGRPTQRAKVSSVKTAARRNLNWVMKP